MKTNRTILWLISLSALLSACTSQSVSNTAGVLGPQSWIDAPLDGTSFPPSPIIEITSHSTDPLHIVQVELSVNGQVVQSSPSANSAQTLALTTHLWSPPGPGNYILLVRAQNSASVWGDSAKSVVTIGDAPQATPTPPAALPLPFVVPSSTLVAKPTGPIASPLPAASITFYADATSLVSGRCTTIHWQVANVSQVALDNAPVNPSGTRQDCPSQTTTHILRVTTLDKQTVQRTLTINVISPSRTFTPFAPTPTRTALPPAGCSGTPVISSFAASPSSITLGGSSTLTWGAVTNADSVEIDNGIGGVASPGTRSVTPGTTTVYMLTARCKGSATTARALVTVLQPPTPTTIFRRLPTATPTRGR